MKFLKVKILIVVSLISISTLYSQQDKDLKVGLVLSGGGAKGLAHIGVLKVIDEVGIKIDYIGGTSTGAIVGALYSSGYSGNQIDSIFRRPDFISHIKENIPGQNMHSELARLLYHVSDINDFTKLPIPFFCIGTDIRKNKPILIDKGYLPSAVTGGGSFPSFYRPGELDDKTLITDGSTKYNYPASDLIKLGVDFVIGVDVYHGLWGSQFVGGNQVMFQIYNDSEHINKIKDITDIYIRPSVEDYSVNAFDESIQIINEGEKAAKLQLENLKKIAELNKVNSKRKKIPLIDGLIISSLEVKGSRNWTRSFVLRKLKIKTGEKISFKALEQSISNLYSAVRPEHFYFDLRKRKKGNKLLIRVDKSYKIPSQSLNNEEVSIQSKGSLPLNSRIEKKIKTFTYKALLISNDNYGNGIEQLKFPVKDAERLKKVLIKKYSFKKENIVHLKNATQNETINTLDSLRKQITKDDNLLIFYAGHGEFDEGMQKGYWLPTDAISNQKGNWLSNSIIRDYLETFNSQHTLLISDACFSGSILEFSRDLKDKPNKVTEKLLEKKSRKAMTSGLDKVVPDKSEFLKYLIQELESNKKSYIRAGELFNEIKESILSNTNNIPQFEIIKNAGHEGGEFVFFNTQVN